MAHCARRGNKDLTWKRMVREVEDGKSKLGTRLKEFELEGIGSQVCALAKHLENCSAKRACTPCTTLHKQFLASLMQFLGLCVASPMGRFVPVQVGSHGAVLSTPPL